MRTLEVKMRENQKHWETRTSRITVSQGREAEEEEHGSPMVKTCPSESIQQRGDLRNSHSSQQIGWKEPEHLQGRSAGGKRNWGVVCCAKLLSRVPLFATLWTVAHQAPLSMGILQGKNTGAGCHALLQGIFLTWELNLCLLAMSPALAGWGGVYH